MKVREFYCENCGKFTISTNKGGKEQRFCSESCRKKARQKSEGWCGDVCPYNGEVLCADPKCETCGWNPSVEKMRKDALAIEEENA